MLGQVDRRQRDGLQLQHDDLLTRLGADVAAVALRAAVLLVRAAHGTLQRAAAPHAREEPAAGGAFRAPVQPVALHGAGLGLNAGGGWKLGVPGDHEVSPDARGPALVALVVGGAAVVAVRAAHGLRQWATSPLL